MDKKIDSLARTLADPHDLIRFARAVFVALPEGVLWWDDERILVVADLHLEKGSSFARRGMLLPPYDTLATLERLGRVLGRLAPRLVVALGDSFHDPQASGRLDEASREGLARMASGRDWAWIAGNHDPAPPEGLAGFAADELRIGSVVFRHEPMAGPSPGEVAGHLHPAAVVVGKSGSVRRRCFVTDGTRCVMPSFGAYAGGLNVRHAAFARLFGDARRVNHVLGTDRVYRVPDERCAPGR